MSPSSPSPDANGVATLWLNAPPLNILDLETTQRLAAVVEAAADDDRLRLLIVRGAGERAFSAGVSIQDHVPGQIEPTLAAFHRLCRGLRALPSIALAVVHGHCLGGGLELASACDLIIASAGSRFALPEIKLGCYPPLAAALYPRLIGTPLAMDLILTGRVIDAEAARSAGLVSRVIPDDELDAAVDEIVAEITSQSGAALRLSKRAVRLGEALELDPALEATESLYLRELVQTEDMNEGIASFLEKRPPQWQHR